MKALVPPLPAVKMTRSTKLSVGTVMLIRRIKAAPVKAHVRGILPVGPTEVSPCPQPIWRNIVDGEVLVPICYPRFCDDSIGCSQRLIGERFITRKLDGQTRRQE